MTARRAIAAWVLIAVAQNPWAFMHPARYGLECVILLNALHSCQK